MEARLQESLSQEGTGVSGESLPESNSGSPTYSGRGNILPTHAVETIALDDDDNEAITLEDDDNDTTSNEPIRPKINIRNSSDGTESEPNKSGLQNELINKNQYFQITNLTRKLTTLTDNLVKLIDDNPTTVTELKNGIWDIKNHLDCLNERLTESGEYLPCSDDVGTQTENMDLIDDIKAKIRIKDVTEILDKNWPEVVYTATTVEKGDLDAVDSDWDIVVIVVPKTGADERSDLEKRLLPKRPEASGLLQGIEAGAVKFVLCTVLQIERCTFVLPCALSIADMLTQFIALHKKSIELSRPGKFAVFIENSLNVTNTRKIMEAAFSGSGAKGKIIIEKDTLGAERPEKRKIEAVATDEVAKKAKHEVTAVELKETGVTVQSVQMVIKELAEAGWSEVLGEELPFKLDIANIGVPNTIDNMPSTSGMGKNHLETMVSNTLETARNAGHPRLQGVGMVGAGTSAGLQRSYIWSGVIEWMEKGKTPGDQQKTTKHLHCQVSASTKDIEPELKVDTWPNKLLMQLMPKQLISNIGGQYLKDSKSVLFHLQPSEALDALTKVMVNGFAGCVHFSQIPSPPQCDIKVLILLYTPDKKAYLGFIPNNQATFVDRLRKVIQQQKISQIISKQQMPAAVSNAPGMPPNMPTSTMAGTGAMATPGMSSGGMGAGMSAGMQPVSVGNVGGVGNVGQMTGPGPSQGMVQGQMQQHPQGMMIGNAMGGQVQQVGGKGPRPVTQLDGLEAARQQNLEKIQHLQQTLEAAHQQEAQFKSQMDIMSHLHAAQQQEQHYKQLEEQRKHQQLQQQLQQQLRATNAAHQPRIMHPRNILPSNPGLRHLLQQQPQYRAGGGGPRPSSQPQQFDDVTNYTDFI